MRISISFAVIVLAAALVFCRESGDTSDFYSFIVKDIDGNPYDLNKLRGTATLVVNVASECGYTDSHYSALTKLQESLSQQQKFQVLAFPCNQFGAQEPAENEQILGFIKSQYNVNFPVMAKINVMGENAEPAFRNLVGDRTSLSNVRLFYKVIDFRFLRVSRAQVFLEQSGKEPTWNFWKYLVDHDGKVVHAWGPHYPVDMIFDDVWRAVTKAGGDVVGTLGNKGFKPEL